MRITVLAGGIGGARFLTGLKVAEPAAEITVVGNVGDDLWQHGLRICPDLDTVMYTLGGGIDTEVGWGRAGDTRAVLAELDAYGADTWFGLGDRDIATHLVRTRMLRAGYPLSAVTEALCDRWQPGVRLLPATDDRLETHVIVDADDSGARRAIHFQEWWVRHRAELPAHGFVMVGAEESTPAPGILESLLETDLVVLAPSNPVVSLGPILAVPGVRDRLRTTTAPVVGISPIIAGAPVRGMADRCLTAVGIETSAEGVGAMFADFLAAWLIDSDDAATVAGVEVLRSPLLMRDTDSAAALARAAVTAGGR